MHLNDPRDLVEVDSILHLVHQIAEGRVRQRLQVVARLASGTHQEVFVEHPVHLCRWWFSRGVGGGGGSWDQKACSVVMMMTRRNRPNTPFLLKSSQVLSAAMKTSQNIKSTLSRKIIKMLAARPRCWKTTQIHLQTELPPPKINIYILEVLYLYIHRRQYLVKVRRDILLLTYPTV